MAVNDVRGAKFKIPTEIAILKRYYDTSYFKEFTRKSFLTVIRGGNPHVTPKMKTS